MGRNIQMQGNESIFSYCLGWEETFKCREISQYLVTAWGRNIQTQGNESTFSYCLGWEETYKCREISQYLVTVLDGKKHTNAGK